jgi:ribonuclease HI
MSEFHTYSDGGARGNPGPSAIGVVFCDAKDHVLYETSQCIGEGTNNVAEYRAMLLALETAKARGAKRLLCSADSQLIIFQLQGRYRIKDTRLAALAEKVKSLAAQFEHITWRQIPREHPLIARADKLLNASLDKAQASGSSHPSPEPHQGELF